MEIVEVLICIQFKLYNLEKLQSNNKHLGKSSLIKQTKTLFFSGEIHLLSHNETREGALPKIGRLPNLELLKVNCCINLMKNQSH